MSYYQITIPNEKESMLPVFDNVVNNFKFYLEEYVQTKDGFVYSFDFGTLKKQNEFMQEVENKLPNLFK